MTISLAITPTVLDTIRPRPHVRTVDWAAQYVSTPRGSEIKGKFRPDLFPHVSEILDCFDDDYYREITFQGASRLGKTVLAQVALAKVAATNPHPMAIADADEKSTKRVINRTWLLFEACEPLAHKLPPDRLRAADHMQLVDCLIHGCWSGSPSTAADFAALVVVLNEIDKMANRKSGEADFAFLMEERAKGYPRSKIIRISTPALKDASRVEAARLAGDNRARYVPCPHCNHFQTLRTGEPTTPGGLRWEKDAEGRSTVAMARETAWYECQKCRKKILDHHRYDMLNAGVWVKEGQAINRKGRITGTPARPGRHASFGPLGSHYSLLPTMGWGTIAAKFVDATQARGNEKLRNYLNSWEGVTWDPNPVRIEPGDVVRRLATDDPMRAVPSWGCFLTLAADVGRVGDELVFYWAVFAWGRGQRGRLIDYDVAVGKDAWLQVIAGATYPHADGGSLRPVRFGLDSSDGNVTNAVVELCRGIPNCWPIKGSADSGFPEVYQLGFVATDIPKAVLKLKRKLNQGDLLVVNTRRSQNWIEDLTLGVTRPTDEAFVDVPAEAFAADPDLAQQLLNEVCVEGVTPTGHTSTRWEKRGPNEWRDVFRYNWTLAWHYTKQGRHWPLITRIAATPAKPKPESRTAGRRALGRRTLSRR